MLLTAHTFLAYPYFRVLLALSLCARVALDSALTIEQMLRLRQPSILISAAARQRFNSTAAAFVTGSRLGA